MDLKRRNLRSQPGISFTITDGVRGSLKRVLPFRPHDCAEPRSVRRLPTISSSMRRLPQGDVGSGKTIVALEAANHRHRK